MIQEVPGAVNPRKMEFDPLSPNSNNPSQVINLADVERVKFQERSVATAEKLIEFILAGRVRNEGLMAQWYWILWRLPRQTKSMVWSELSETIPVDAFRQLHRGYKVFSDRQAGYLISKRQRRVRV